MKTLLAIILFGLALKAFGAGSVKKPVETPMLPDGATAKDEKAAEAQLKAEKFLAQAEAYTDVRLMKRRQHKALLNQLEHVADVNEDTSEERDAERV